MTYYIFKQDGTLRYSCSLPPSDVTDQDTLVESDIEDSEDNVFTLVDGEIVATPFDPASHDYSDAHWGVLREERNRRLAETDYLALPDVTMSEEMRTYRQALRDLPANTTDPANPVWPVKPA